MITRLIISIEWQCETCAEVVYVKHKTERGLIRRAKQLSKKHAFFGDNGAGWINARVAIGSEDDEWGYNQIIGGSWCKPANGWLDFE